jgi:putative DNA primase/helicase
MPKKLTKKPEPGKLGCEDCKYWNINVCRDGHAEFMKRDECPYYDKEEKNPKAYFEIKDDGKLGSFIPALLAKDIEKDYHFATMRDSGALYYYQDGIYRRGGEAIVREEARKRLGDFSKKNHINEVVQHLVETHYEEREKFNNPANLLVVENELLDVEKREIKEHSPEVLITTKLPVNYDPNADCPKIKKFLSEVLHENDIPVVQEVVGYCLLKDYRYAKAVMMLGPGENGKSTLLNLITALLGDKNVATPSLQDLLRDRFAKAELYGKLANIHADIPTIELKNTGPFKMLTGQDMIYAQRKFRDPFNFRNFAKLLYSANQLPKTEDISRAFFRRWIIIDFPNSFPEDDPRRDEKLLEKLTTPEELSGFLNWALEGLQRLLKQGHFTRTKTRKEIEERWITETDSLLAFVRHKVEEDASIFVTTDDFYEAYQKYCAEMDMPVIEKNLIGRNLPTLIPKVRRARKKVDGEQKRVWVGISVDTDKKINHKITGFQQRLGGGE